MGREKFQELTTKPEGLEVLDQKFPVSDEKNLEGTIHTACKDALANNAIRQVIFELEPGAYGKVENYYVTPEYAEKTLPPEEVERIKKVADSAV